MGHNLFPSICILKFLTLLKLQDYTVNFGRSKYAKPSEETVAAKKKGVENSSIKGT